MSTRSSYSSGAWPLTAHITRRRRSCRAIILGLALAVAFSFALQPSLRADAPALKCDDPLASTIARHPASDWSCAIVKIAGDLTLEREIQFKRLGVDIYRHLPIVHSVAVRLPSRNLKRLASLPFVLRLSIDRAVKKSDAFTLDSSCADVAFQQDGLTGQGVTVAVIDSGVHFTNDLATTVKAVLPVSSATLCSVRPIPTTSAGTARTWPASSPETARLRSARTASRPSTASHGRLTSSMSVSWTRPGRAMSAT